jgi:hypothetical protein
VGGAFLVIESKEIKCFLSAPWRFLLCSACARDRESEFEVEEALLGIAGHVQVVEPFLNCEDWLRSRLAIGLTALLLFSHRGAEGRRCSPVI